MKNFLKDNKYDLLIPIKYNLISQNGLVLYFSSINKNYKPTAGIAIKKRFFYNAQINKK